MLLSNSGLEVYNSFDKVIILQTVHRLKQIENPITATDHEYNARADKFLEILHRVRDLTITAGDYFWLYSLKKSKNIARARSFQDGTGTHGLSSRDSNES